MSYTHTHTHTHTQHCNIHYSGSVRDKNDLYTYKIFEFT